MPKNFRRASRAQFSPYYVPHIDFLLRKNPLRAKRARKFWRFCPTKTQFSLRKINFLKGKIDFLKAKSQKFSGSLRSQRFFFFSEPKKIEPHKTPPPPPPCEASHFATMGGGLAPFFIHFCEGQNKCITDYKRFFLMQVGGFV